MQTAGRRADGEGEAKMGCAGGGWSVWYKRIDVLNGEIAIMRKAEKWMVWAVACVALAAGLLGCSEKEPDEVQVVLPEKGTTVQRAPWMDGERWGMTPADIRTGLGKAPELQSKTSDYYPVQFEGKAALAQYVFRQGTANGGQRELVRKIVYLAHPKRAAFLPSMSRAQAEEVFGTVRKSVESKLGRASVVTQEVAVSVKLESQSRVAGDRVKAAEKEVRALEREMEAKRHDLQRQYAGKKNKNAMVAAGLVETEKAMQTAQRKLMALKSEQHQIQQAIHEECEALPEGERPFHWECNWTATDGAVALYLTANVDRTHLALSFEAPE